MDDRTLEAFLTGSKKREKVLVSACLLGIACRYDGKSKKCAEVERLERFFDFVPVCPEVLGGLKTPRDPAEIREGKVMTRKGRDVTQNYKDGAYWALAACKVKGIRLAILKENSPSCGVHDIHDGLFSGKTIEGKGIAAQTLEKNHIAMIDEEEAKTLLAILEERHA